MGEKWRRVDDEEKDDEVHLSIQEGKHTLPSSHLSFYLFVLLKKKWVLDRENDQGGWWSCDSTAACSGESPPLGTACGAPLGSPTIIGREEERGRGWFQPPLLLHCRLPNGLPEGDDPPASRWDLSSVVCAGGRWGRAATWKGGLPSMTKKRGSTSFPLPIPRGQLVNRTS
ncbi:hypothetical protein Sjap_005037 [Stephania japonica]|uniref:Uncharacterized protein n=1 Tax=Stephania japonica TaxID=461633 RepID=A0AAP0PJN3_9MAGN